MEKKMENLGGASPIRFIKKEGVTHSLLSALLDKGRYEKAMDNSVFVLIGHFYFGKNRTFLNWLDKRTNFLDIPQGFP
jgi:hypothetical protein